MSACRAADAAPPPVNLTVQIREVPADEAVEPGSGAAAAGAAQQGVGISTLDAPASARQVVSVHLLNGTRSVLRIDRSEPFQWVQAAQVVPLDRGSKTAAASHPGAAVVNALGWVGTGHSVALTAHWPGGRRPAVVDIVFESASPTDPNGSNPPGTQRQHAQTTLSVPLGHWVTFAKIGAGAAETAGTWSTLTLQDAPQRWWQLKVLAP
jgi:hypothetical protein